MATVINISNLQEMKAFAEKIAQQVFPGFLIGLEGDLGAGKTTFTQYFGAALGIKSPISSPTFTIVKIYDEGTHPLIHVDAYRLEGKKYDAEIEELLDSNSICVVEWYPYIEESLPREYLSIRIEYIDETKRKLIVKGYGKYESISKTIGH